MRFFAKFRRAWAVAGMAAACAIGPGAAKAVTISAPEGGAIRALIVGIDKYSGVRPLHGAVADAIDLQTSLLKAGVPKDNIRLILNDKAVRDDILAEMQRLVEVSQPKDLVILSFAGHGSRVPEMYPNTKANHKDEAYILANFKETSSTGAREIIAGPEIKHWIGLLDKKEVDILFIADTCHAGGLTRAPVRSDLAPTTRFSVIKYSKAEANKYSTAADAGRSATSFSHLSFVAAVDSDRETPEVTITIAGQQVKRGALSFAVSRAIESTVKGGNKGPLTRKDLYEYAQQQVLHYSDNLQVIYTQPEQPDALGKPIFRTIAGPAPQPEPQPGPGPEPSPGVAQSGPLRIAVENASAAEVSGVPQRVFSFVIADDKQSADIVWDAAAGLAYSGTDIVARDVKAADIPGVVDRVATSRLLARLSEGRPQIFRLKPDNSLHHKGENIGLEADDVTGKHLIAFNITGDGMVQYLFPLPSENPLIESKDWSISDISVTDHFGSDQVVVVTSPTHLIGLETALRGLDKTSNAGNIPELLSKYLDTANQVRIGLATVVTAP
jgi:hypothetical protein